ncbi:MAG: phosphate acetyltransferase [Rhodospirillaceae bacterium]|nr:phosphate acetyltransferase [Rhodospirillaceae bacterium]|tara:strand:+ start:702 stop:1694 length:993 start_codon:yes stop_codon:yes gene_type:complete
MTFLEKLESSLKNKKNKVVFPEGTEEAILLSTTKLIANGTTRVTLLGDAKKIEETAIKNKISLNDVEIIEPKHSNQLDKYITQYLEKRPKTPPAVVRRLLMKPLFYGGAMVNDDAATAMVAGIATPSSQVITASLMTVGLAKGIQTPSTAFLMLISGDKNRHDQPLLFADCALNVNPTENQLADIAISSAKSYLQLTDKKPRVALLSFATHGSDKYAEIRKIRGAKTIINKRAPKLDIEGEIQADAALVPRIANRKMKDKGNVAGNANVLIFPDLNAGNISYKLMQHLGGATAIGPFFQGLAKPISDLSRGASENEIIATTTLALTQRQQ